MWRYEKKSDIIYITKMPVTGHTERAAIMARQKKNARYTNVYLEISIADTLDRYSEESGIPKTRIVEQALTAYFKKNKVTIKADKKPGTLHNAERADKEERNANNTEKAES